MIFVFVFIPDTIRIRPNFNYKIWLEYGKGKIQPNPISPVITRAESSPSRHDYGDYYGNSFDKGYVAHLYPGVCAWKMTIFVYGALSRVGK